MSHDDIPLVPDPRESWEDPLWLLENDPALGYEAIEELLTDPARVGFWVEYLAALRRSSGEEARARKPARVESRVPWRILELGVEKAVLQGEASDDDLAALLRSPHDLRQLHFDIFASDSSFLERRAQGSESLEGVGSDAWESRVAEASSRAPLLEPGESAGSERPRLLAGQSPEEEVGGVSDLEEYRERIARDGSAAAFEWLHATYTPLLASVVRKAGVGPDDVDDVLQEIFLKAVRFEFGGLEVGGPRCLAAYLSTCARRAAWKAKKRASLLRDHLSVLAEGVRGPTRSTAGIDNELDCALDEAIGQLDQRHRAVITLRVIHGLSNKEISARPEVGLSNEAVGKLYFEAVRRLRAIVERKIEKERTS